MEKEEISLMKTLEKTLHLIENKSKGLSDNELKELDQQISLLIDDNQLYTFDYPKGYSGHIDFNKVFHNAEIHKLIKYLFYNKRYSILEKYINT